MGPTGNCGLTGLTSTVGLGLCVVGLGVVLHGEENQSLCICLNLLCIQF